MCNNVFFINKKTFHSKRRYMLKQIKTKDGSMTGFSDKYDEYYHSVTGAREEAVKKYAEPCRIADLARCPGKIVILDFCFGMGYNSAAAIDSALEANPNCIIEITGLENDLDLLEGLQEINGPFRSYGLIKKAASELSIKEGNVAINLLPGDAAETVMSLTEFEFDVVFFDPFSPKRQPELWTEEIFTNIYVRMRDGGILATYSCARSVRDALRGAGFLVKDGPPVGRRGPSTLAIK
ncbi:hypothetical protein COV93_04325 [Candidatus Woesearchaeota archaeon CG11_big_fil_rev_8_21_14_0_20_43_8]|nr:MAG: hypothetical protein COV93_04325 [Candidatus Woesearchaeota archaeon CG11_big_fil_rev_8_21_14_0_20_43_8]PIO08981.1 MAG: hypothetical protein COT47_00350 [Candidatus Woesearchaeota archaeon CG08_land_8_20_14_0_20_43_7]